MESLTAFQPLRSSGTWPNTAGTHARARGLGAEEVGRLLAAILVEFAAGLPQRALVLAYPLNGGTRSEVLNLAFQEL